MLTIHGLRYRYPGRQEDTLHDLSCTIKKGEMVLLAGRSGCGKSTLLKAVTGILLSEGRGKMEGTIRLNGKEIGQCSPEEIGRQIGIVYQNPDDQLFAMTVRDETAFFLENMGLEEAEIEKRVRRILELVGLGGMEEKSVHALSGGQRQRLALASVLVGEPSLLILDEPISQMNPQGAEAFLNLLKTLNEERGLSILLIEHRVHEAAAYFPRMMIMHEGCIRYDGPTKEVWRTLAAHEEFGLREPQNIRLCRMLDLPDWHVSPEKTAEEILARCRIHIEACGKIQAAEKKILAKGEALSYRYEGAPGPTLKDVSFTLYQGEITALMGYNGAGKSTLLNILGGLAPLQQGRLLLDGKPWKPIAGRVGYLRQETDLMLLADTVREELAWNNERLEETEIQAYLQELDLAEYADDFPLALSKGQRLRLVLGAILARRPGLLLLDEPTAGQDKKSLDAIKEVLKRYTERGGTVLFCTHDTELAAEIADQVLFLAHGSVLAEGPARELLANREWVRRCGLIPARMLDTASLLKIPPCLTAEEVCGYVDAAVVGRCGHGSLGKADCR